jgi:hypothetical protein
MPIAFDARSVRIRNRSKGMSGSAVARSMSTNATNSATLATSAPMIIGEPQP